MATKLITSGTGNIVKDSLISFSYSEDATPLEPTSINGGTSQVSFSGVEETSNAGLINTKLMIGNSTSIQDDSYGTVQFDVKSVSTNAAGIASIVGDSIQSKLNVIRTAAPFSGTLSAAITYYCGLCGVTPIVDSALLNRSVNFIGWNDNVWEQLKKLCSVMSYNTTNRSPIEIYFTGTAVGFRPALASSIDLVPYQSDINQSVEIFEAAQTIDVYSYGTSLKYNNIVYDISYYDDNASNAKKEFLSTISESLQVNAGESLTKRFQIDASLTSVKQPNCVSRISPLPYDPNINPFPNYVTNSFFETNINGWSGYGTTGVARATSFNRQTGGAIAPYSDTGLMLTSSPAGTPSGALYITTNTGFSLPLTPGVSYTVSARNITYFPTSVNVGINWYNGASFISQSAGPGTPSSNTLWKEITYTATAPAGTTRAEVVGFTTNAFGGYEESAWDNFILQETSHWLNWGNGQYVVVGSDNLPIKPSQWLGLGGSLVVSLTENPNEIEITITAPEQTSLEKQNGAGAALAPYRIGIETSGSGFDYPAIYIVGAGVFYNRTKTTFSTGANSTTTTKTEAPEVDNIFVTDSFTLSNAGLSAAQAVCGPRVTVNGSSASGFSFGSTIGSSFNSNSNRFRLNSISFNERDVSWNAEQAVTFSSFNSVNTGKTFSQFNTAITANMTFTDLSVIPLTTGA